MSELKPCQRCGAEAHVVTEDGEPTMFLCEDCGSWLDVSEFETTENAFKWWNDRPFIDALQARIAELEEKQRWIPVSRELPKEYRDEEGEFIPFLVCESDKDYPFRAIYDGTNWGDGMFVVDVTHWMPLPKPPEVQE